MKKMKIASALMAGLILCSSLAGCGEKKTGAGLTEVVVWSADSHMKAFMVKKVDEFNSGIGKEKGIKLVWELKENDLSQQLEVAVENGKGPDIYPPVKMQEDVENGNIVSLDDIPELKELVARNNSVRVEKTNVYNGKMYMFPISSQVYGLAYNKDMFKAAGIVDEDGEAKPPVTLAEMREDAKILTNDANQQYGIILPLKWSGQYYMEIENTSMGITGSIGYDAKTGKYDYSAIKPMIETIMGMKEDGSVYPGANGIDNDPARARFAEGNIGMKLAVSWDVSVWNDQFPAQCDWGIAPIPTISENEKYYQLNNYGWGSVISSKGIEEKGADKVAAVYNWLYSDDMQREYYKSGSYLPWRADIIEGTELDSTVKKGWRDFGEIVKISKAAPSDMPLEASSFEGRGNLFLNKVWTGEMSVDDWVDTVNKAHNDGIEEYKKLHPDEDYSDRIIPDYDISRK